MIEIKEFKGTPNRPCASAGLVSLLMQKHKDVLDLKYSAVPLPVAGTDGEVVFKPCTALTAVLSDTEPEVPLRIYEIIGDVTRPDVEKRLNGLLEYLSGCEGAQLIDLFYQTVAIPYADKDGYTDVANVSACLILYTADREYISMGD